MSLIGRAGEKSASGEAVSLWLRVIPLKWKREIDLCVPWMMSMRQCFLTVPWGEGKVLIDVALRLHVSYWPSAPSMTLKQQSQWTQKGTHALEQCASWSVADKSFIPRLCGPIIQAVVWYCLGVGSSKITSVKFSLIQQVKLDIKINFKN